VQLSECRWFPKTIPKFSDRTRLAQPAACQSPYSLSYSGSWSALLCNHYFIRSSSYRKLVQDIKSRTHWEPRILLHRNVRLSLCLTTNHAMKTYWGVEVQLHAFLISELDGGEWSASRSGRFTPGSLDRRLGGTQSRSRHSGEEKKFPASSGDRTPIVQPEASSLWWAIVTHLSYICITK
jgi:hypothetical protein